MSSEPLNIYDDRREDKGPRAGDGNFQSTCYLTLEKRLARPGTPQPSWVADDEILCSIKL